MAALSAVASDVVVITDGPTVVSLVVGPRPRAATRLGNTITGEVGARRAVVRLLVI